MVSDGQGGSTLNHTYSDAPNVTRTKLLRATDTMTTPFKVYSNTPWNKGKSSRALIIHQRRQQDCRDISNGLVGKERLPIVSETLTCPLPVHPVTRMRNRKSPAFAANKTGLFSM